MVIEQVRGMMGKEYISLVTQRLQKESRIGKYTQAESRQMLASGLALGLGESSWSFFFGELNML